MVTQREGNSALRAAEYVRMSTEHQQYSTENQAAKIREYAARRNIEIVRTYADEGKSGLRLEGRLSLQQMIKDVVSGETDFEIILVYDVSRWGRFQDADESAYLEYICRREGIQVIYCAEQFENDGSPVSTIVKGVKRAMAGEYSRELSAKVFAGQCRLIEHGYRQGGNAGYGLRRMLIDQSGNFKAELKRGEHKSLQTDRVILVPGPEEEIRVVNQIYQWFIQDNLTPTEISKRLVSLGLKNDLGRDWRPPAVVEVLTNEKYIGNNIYNRISFKLKKRRIKNTPEMWIKNEGSFQPIVSKENFYLAQSIFEARAKKFSNTELVEMLKTLYQKRGFLSGLIINETEGMPSAATYVNRFGSLSRAYQQVGFTPNRDYRFIEINKLLRVMHPEIVSKTHQAMLDLGGRVTRDPVTDLLTLNDEMTISLVIARCTLLKGGVRRWKIRFDTSLMPDITVAVRLDSANKMPLDYYLLPRLDFGESVIKLAERNGIEYECYRHESLDYLYGMAEQTPVRRAA